MDISADDPTVKWANWPFYLDEDDAGNHPSLDAFVAATGIKAEYLVDVDDNNSYFAKVKDQLALGQDVGADTVCLTEWMVSRLIRRGYTQKFNLDNIPNHANLVETLANPDFDPGRQQSLPWQGGFAGIAYNTEKLPGGLKNIDDLWSADLKGRVTVLSEMRDKGLDFEVVLKEAQRLGYAEADPTFDIEGVDAAHKATLMSALAYGIPVQFDKAYVEGITRLGSADIKYAEQLGYRIKLLGIAKRTAKGVELRVHPSLVPTQRLIANVEGAMNAVMVQGDAVGTTLYYGKGAGAEPTASAVVADLVDITRLHTADPQNRVPHLAFQPDALTNLPVLPMEEVVTSYYLRLRVADEAGVLAKLTGLLAEAGISIDAILQREADQVSGANQTDVIILTHDTREGTMNGVLAQMQALPTVLAPIVRIRKEELA